MARVNSQNEITYYLSYKQYGILLELEELHDLPPKIKEFLKLFCYNGANTRYDSFLIKELVRVYNENAQSGWKCGLQQLRNLLEDIRISRAINKDEESKALRYMQQKALVMEQIRERDRSISVEQVC